MRSWRLAATASLALLVIGFGVHQFEERLRHRFSLADVALAPLNEPLWQMEPLSTEEWAQVEQLLQQPFRYLGEGYQSYVFESADGAHVLKFIKQQPEQASFWTRCGAWAHPRRAFQRCERDQRRREEVLQIGQSWKLAFERARDDSQLLYLHLNRTDQMLGSVRLVTKSEEQLDLPLDQVPFLIQKRCDPFRQAVEGLIQQGAIEQAGQLVEGLVDLMVATYRGGLKDRDRWVVDNSGVIDGRTVHLDVGSFVQTDSEPSAYESDLFSKAMKVRPWLQRLSPDVAARLEQRLQRELGERYFSHIFYDTVRRENR
jgi:hypothetical protein